MFSFLRGSHFLPPNNSGIPTWTCIIVYAIVPTCQDDIEDVYDGRRNNQFALRTSSSICSFLHVNVGVKVDVNLKRVL